MEFFKTIVEIVELYYKQILRGVGSTVVIALVSTVIGLILGIIAGVIKTTPSSKNPIIKGIQKTVNFLISCYVEIFRGTPMMVQAAVIYWGYAFLAHETLPELPSAIFIVSINTGAYMAEIVRGGIMSIDKGQFEGSKALGMTHAQTMIHVVIPQVLKNILPAVSNEFVINIKDTSVLSIIGVKEFFYQIDIAAKTTYNQFECFAIACVIYFILTFTVTRILRLFEKKLHGKDDYTICGSQSDFNSQIKVKGGANNE